MYTYIYRQIVISFVCGSFPCSAQHAEGPYRPTFKVDQQVCGNNQAHPRTHIMSPGTLLADMGPQKGHSAGGVFEVYDAIPTL